MLEGSRGMNPSSCLQFRQAEGGALVKIWRGRARWFLASSFLRMKSRLIYLLLKPRTLMLLLAVAAGERSLTADAATKAVYVANLENQTKPSVHYTGLPWKVSEDGYLEGRGGRSQLWGLPAPEAGDFRLDAEVKLPGTGRASRLVLGASSEITLTSGGRAMLLRGRFFQTGETPVEVVVPVVKPAEAFRLSVQRRGGEVTISHSGQEVYRGPCATGPLTHAGFDPALGVVQIYSFTAEGALAGKAELKPFSNPFGMQLRKPPAKASEVMAPVLVGQTPSQECTAITRRDGTLEVYFITKPEGDSVSFMQSKDGGLTWGAPQVAFRLAGQAHYGIQALEDDQGAVHIVFHLFGQGAGGYNGRLYEVYYTRSTEQGKWSSPLRVIPGYVGSIRGFIRLKSGRLVLGAGVAVPTRAKAPLSGPDLGWNDTVVYYSDDGVEWKKSPDILQVELPGENATRYGAIEPALVQLNDGRVWMLIRDRGGRLYESYSADGSRWSKAVRTTFISSDSPAALLRLKDGRLLILWNPCQNWTDPRSYAMGGREVLQAAVSADDGRTWSGFREVLHETNQASGGDRGTAYSSPTETADGKILVFAGQGEGKRALLLFDPGWLMEKEIRDDLENGPVFWTQYGDEGLVVESVERDKKAAAIPLNSAGLCGAAWNFPGRSTGGLGFRLWVPAEAAEVVLGLNDHFNRVDDVKAAEHLIFKADLAALPRNEWQDVGLTWNDSEITLTVNGKELKKLPGQRPAVCPLSYLRVEAKSGKNTGAVKLSGLTAFE